MTRRLGLALTLCFVLTSGGRADGPTAAVPVEQLIEQLGSRDFKTREAASVALAERAEEALPALRKALAHPDPEVRQRLGRLIADTERALLLAPKRVSLKLDHVPVRDALAELARQSGYRLDLQGSTSDSVSLQTENATFWEAFDKLCAQTGLVLQPHNDTTGGLTVYPQNAFVPFVDYRGPFRLAAAGFHYNKSLSFATLPRNQLSGGQRSEQLSFTFSVVAEPKLPLLGLGQPRLSVAVDDQDNSLLPPLLGRLIESQYGYSYYGYRSTVLQTQVQLAGHGGTARSVKLLKGTLPVTLLAEQKPDVVVEDILKVKNQKFEGAEVALEIESVREMPGNAYHVTLTARRISQDNPNDYTWTNSLQQRVELTDAQGNKFLPHGFNWNNGTPTSVQGTFMFGTPGGGALGKPAKLTYYTWVTLQHQVEFAFRDLPLP